MNKFTFQKPLFGSITEKTQISRDSSKLFSPEPKPKFLFNLNPNSLPNNIPEESPRNFAERIQAQLIKDGIFPPSLAVLDYNKEQSDFINVASELRTEFLKYRERVRSSLIKANLLDDPFVPKKLKDAIDFKGTCDEMCPVYECLTRMVDRRYDKTERDVNSDGSLAPHPNPEKMVKALARSAAGQDAPLPSDIRTAAALKKTVDYLFNTVLAKRDLESVHGFLWDRTRAIRRDFVFHSSMTPSELVDQVYCLERIIRFHVISLHQMSKAGISTEGFSDQQEREQLSKSLLSLIHAYEDCRLQNVHCENEIEFKAYYILFNGEIPGILETVQNWGWEVWENSEIIRIAASLSESLQNTWEFHGPLNPVSTMEISQNAYSRFFSIVEDPSVSYSMACFAEIYFNKIRKAIMRTILSSYRKQRGQTKDWTSENLNKYLRFDNENEVEPFVEMYGLHFTETDNEWCLSFESTSSIQDPHPLPKQPQSYYLVERKRGSHTLSEAINRSVYESKSASAQSITQSTFVTDSSSNPHPKTVMNPGLESNFQASSEIVTSSDFKESSPTPSKTVTSSDSKDNSLTSRLNCQKENGDLFNYDSCSRTRFTFSQPDSAVNPKDTCLINLQSSPGEMINKSPSKLHHEIIEDQLNSNSSFGSFKTTHQKLLDSKSTIQFSFDKPKFAVAEVKGPTTSSSTNRSPSQDQTEFPKSSLVQPSKVALLGSQSPVSRAENYTGTGLMSSRGFSTSAALSESALVNSKSQMPMSPYTSLPVTDSGSKISDFKSTINSSHENKSEKVISDKRNNFYDKLTQWMVEGEEGLLAQFAEFQANQIVYDIFTQFKMAQLKKSQEEADKETRNNADNFRIHSLSVKFGYLWREQARRLRLKRKGREARQARLELAKQLKSKNEALSANIIGDLRTSTSVRGMKRDGTLTEVYDSSSGVDDSVKKKHSAHKRRRSTKTLTSCFSSPFKQQDLASVNPQNRSLFSDSSYLSGKSRSHLLVSHLGDDQKHRPVNGVSSDYFRLKARGITNLIGQSPTFDVESEFKNYQIHDSRMHVRSLGGSKMSGKPNLLHTTQGIKQNLNLSYEPKIEPLNLITSNEFSLVNNEAHQNTCEDDDSALFQRAKRVKEQMDEGADWFRTQIKQDVL